MPNYDYICDACGDRFEAFHSMAAKPLTKCKKCGKSKLRRLISGGAGVLFKGSGFYQTDYRSKKYQESSKKDLPPPSKSKEKSAGDTSCGGGSCKQPDVCNP